VDAAISALRATAGEHEPGHAHTGVGVSPAAGGPKVLLLAGSPSDLDRVVEAQAVLEELGIEHAIRVASAHRTPELVADVVGRAESEGFGVIVAFAGLSAHLAGSAAAHTQLPVIGVPLSVGSLGGLEAALATLQMPPGTPVAGVAIDGARNGALLAARILALGYPDVRRSLSERAERERARYSPDRIAEEIEKRTRRGS
jgi:5-(carboxyamino)imidazole ribonucleotide mutase